MSHENPTVVETLTPTADVASGRGYVFTDGRLGIAMADVEADTPGPFLTTPAVAVDGAPGALLVTNNLSDVANAATARSNLSLGNVNNTADASKPVSTAQAAADAAVLASAQAYTDGLKIKSYRWVGSAAAPLTAGESGDLATLSVEPLATNGDMVTAHMRWSAGNEASESSSIRVYVGSVLIFSASIGTATRSAMIYFVLERVDDTTVRVTPTFVNENNGVSNSVFGSFTVSSLAAGLTFAFRLDRGGAPQTKTVTLLRASAVVERV
jgi:hypothetical protein